MELALYCPDCGYYEKEDDNIGRRGDFYTSVSVGPLFGELLAFQFAGWLAELETFPLQIVEAGAHDGKLGRDILRWFRQYRPRLFDSIEYVICEPSARYRRRQRDTLKEFAHQVRWLDADVIRPKDRFSGVIFANELMDAMPTHRVGWDARQHAWFEWGVTAAADSFIWSRMNSSKILSAKSSVSQRLTKLQDELLDVLPDNFATELCPAAEYWWRNAGRALQRGRLLTLDYGLPAEEFFSPQRSNGTLRAYHRHRLCKDLLANVGEQDLTAHVNFSAIQEVGESIGLRTEAFTTQSDFLGQIMKQFWPEAEDHGGWTANRSREFQTLVHPEHLGRAFRVLVQSR